MVYVRDYISRNKWLQGVIVSDSMFRICLNNGRERNCHADQIRSREAPTTQSDTEEGERDSNEHLLVPSRGHGNDIEPNVSPSNTSVSIRSNPSRNRHPPKRYVPKN